MIRAATAAIIVATRNVNKAAELRALLAVLRRPIVDLDHAGIPFHPDEDDVENQATFEGNALAKARYFHARGAGAPVIADDSGLCVDALSGAPGVHSRRYAGATGTAAEVSEANCQRLLHALDGQADRRASFVCALAYMDASTVRVAVGRTDGRILDAPAGVNGFGYDPLFWSDDLQASFGVVGDVEKARVSHRARAVDALVTLLQARV